MRATSTPHRWRFGLVSGVAVGTASHRKVFGIAKAYPAQTAYPVYRRRVAKTERILLLIRVCNRVCFFPHMLRK